jgi:alpha-L-fucosidase
MFSDAGPAVRWVGNERGFAGDPCWATLDAAGRYPGCDSKGLNPGERQGAQWIPAECDVSIRPGWFYHPKEDSRVKTPTQLLDIYYKSVGRGACLNLNIPPDRRGQIADPDIHSLRAFRHILDATFATNLAANAHITASNVRDSSKQFAAENVLDPNRETYWTTDDGTPNPELVLDFGKPITFNVVSLREFLPLGQRIDAFALDRWENGAWLEFAAGTSIGNHRLIRCAHLNTSKIRLRIAQAAACPALSEFGVYSEPSVPDEAESN